VTSIIDAWRAVDPEAKLVSGSVDLLTRPVRGVARTRAAPPHLPPVSPGQLLVADAGVLDDDLDRLMAALGEAELEPAAIWLVGEPVPGLQRAGSPLPVIAGGMGHARLADALGAYLEAERQQLAAAAVEVRLAGAEAALADPQPGAPAGVLAGRLQRGVAVIVDGALAALNPRPAGTALATRFAAAHARLLGDRSASAPAARRTRDGLWTLERRIGPTASAWLFDDLPFGAIDEVSLEALAVTLRALLRRPPASTDARTGARMPPSTGDAVRDTLLAVARSNGRIAPAARSLGVHRNTVLYRLQRASINLGIDPRRPEDALRLLQSAERSSD
jgi:hypothetical protein